MCGHISVGAEPGVALAKDSLENLERCREVLFRGAQLDSQFPAGGIHPGMIGAGEHDQRATGRLVPDRPDDLRQLEPAKMKIDKDYIRRGAQTRLKRLPIRSMGDVPR